MASSEFKADADKEARLFLVLDTYKQLCGEEKNWHAFMENKFPSSEVWRFFIDGTRQNEGLRLLNDFKNIEKYYQDKGISLSLLDKKLDDLLKPSTYENIPPGWREYYYQSCSKVISDGLKLIKETRTDMTLQEFGMRGCGWLPFIRTEPHYLTPLIREFRTIPDMKQATTTDYVRSLHGKATKDVKNLDERSTSGEFRAIQDVAYRLDPANTTIDGLKDLLDKIEIGHPGSPEFALMLVLDNEIIHLMEYKRKNQCSDNRELAAKLFEKISSGSQLALISYIDSNVQNVISKVMADYIEDFNKNMKPDMKPIDKLRVIARFIRDCEQLHPFADANCRTLCMLALDQILAKNGFPIPILANPNHFDCYSVEELVTEMIAGMEHTMAVAQGKMDLYGITTKEILAVATREEMAEAISLGIAPPTVVAPSSAQIEASAFNYGPPGALRRLSLMSPKADVDVDSLRPADPAVRVSEPSSPKNQKKN